MAKKPPIESVLKKAVSETNKVVGDGIRMGSEALASDIRWLPTLSPLIDWLLGGGIPLGRVLELYGDPSHGKSSLAMDLMLSVQQAGGVSVILDAEKTWDRDRAKRVGIQDGQLIYYGAETLEGGFTVAVNLLKMFRDNPDLKDLPKIIVWDTLGHSQTEAEMAAEGDASKMWKDGMMAKPRKIRAGLRMITPLLFEASTCFVFVNQVIIQPTSFGSMKTTPGPGVHFAASARVKVWRCGKFELRAKEEIGIRSNLKTTKNKMTAPNREVDVPITFDYGIDHRFELFDYAVKNMRDTNIITVSPGGWYSLHPPEGETKKMHSIDFAQFFEENPKVLGWLRDEVVKHLNGVKS